MQVVIHFPLFLCRSVIAGLLVGAILCFSNTYFGLQTGWVTMGSLQSALLGYGIFRLLAQLRPPYSSPFLGFSIEENVVLQTTAVATATMPLAAGFVGIVPAFGEQEEPAPLTRLMCEVWLPSGDTVHCRAAIVHGDTGYACRPVDRRPGCMGP